MGKALDRTPMTKVAPPPESDTVLWTPGPLEPSLESDEIHLWLAWLDVEPRRLEMLSALLSEEEKTRAGRFRSHKDRNRFIVARGFLRHVLARYLRVSPERICFRYTPHGKPMLAPISASAEVRFSLCHSQGLALCAVALERDVGVDLERVRFDCAAKEIATRFFSAQEQAAILSLPEPARTVTFFRYWTVKEACLKATGLGLWSGLQGLVIALGEDEARVLRWGKAKPHDEKGWGIKTFEPQPGYTAALAAPGRGWRMRAWLWQEE